MSGDEGANRRRGLGARLAAIAGAIEHALDAVGEVVQSAGELLVDNDLRRKGAQYIVDGASRSIDEAQRGIEAGAQTLQAGARARIGAGARQLQNVLRNIERQVQDFQKQQQQRDLQAELQHHHKLPVDIQVGHQLLEDMPQEMRSRFWYVLLQRPDLALALMSDAQPRQTTGSQQQGASNTAAAGADAPAAGSAAASSSSSSSSASTAAAAAANGSSGLSHLQCSSAGGCEPASAEGAAPVSPFASYCDSPEPSTDLPAPAPAAPATPAPAPQQQEPGALLQVAAPSAQPAEAAPDCSSTEEEREQTAAAAAAGEEAQAEAGSRLATIDRVPDIDDLLAQPTADSLEQPQQGHLQPEPEPAADQGTAEPPGVVANDDASGDGTAAASAASAAPNAAAGDDISRFLTAVPAVAPSPWEAGSAANRHSSCSSSSAVSSNPSAPSPWAVLSPTSAAAEGDAVGRHSSSSHAASAAAPEQAAASGEGDGWELVSRDVPSAAVGGEPGSGSNNGNSNGNGNGASPFELETLATLQSLVQSLSAEELSDPALAAQQAVFRLMAEVPWTAGAGIPSDWQQDSEYTTLLEAGCGPVEEVILRDVPRTFPEHPLFSAGADGQQRLLRLLKAYAAGDPEVGYCQGMAFAAGVLLMYLPEEAAFRLYRRIMTGGPTLRRLYLPGLEQLKLELARFELLLAAHDPELHAHLTEAGLPALLYAAQWLMTCFACPFPVHVAARLLDVLLQSGGDGVLPRLGLAVMAQLREQLLALDDFEALITAIKVKPLSWPLAVHRQVIDAALYSPATDAELAATSAAVEAEFARLGRPASFSARHLSRQHEAAAALASSGSSGCISRSCELPAAGSRPAAVAAGPADTGDWAQGHTAAQPEPPPQQQPSGSSSDVLRGGQGSGLLGEMDLHLLAEMDMLLVGADGLATSPPAGAAEPTAVPPGDDADE